MSWNIHINGIVIGDEQELREQIPADILEEPANHNALIADILEGASSTQPSEVINQWSEREPGIMSMLEFVQPPNPFPEIQGITERPIDLQISTVAAQGLMSGYEEHLMFLEGSGFMVINEDNPPDIEQAGEITRRLFMIAEAAEKLDEFGKWQRGSFLESCERVYGDNFSVSQFVELSEKNYNTTVTCLNTYRAFRTGRFPNLTFTHHKEAHYSNLPQDNEERTLMRRLLRISDHFRLTCAEQRKLFSYAKNGFDVEVVEEDIAWDGDMDEARANGAITDKVELLNRVVVRESNRNYLFKFQRRWHHFRGVREALPNGATDIICTDDWSEVRPTGATAQIPAWTPVGTPAEEPA